jgi:uncharacterized repeat protein (TIGR01451 family)
VVAIRVRVAACSAPCEEIKYSLCVQNTSPAAAHHVLVRNPLPVNARFVRAVPAPTVLGPELQWVLGTLPPGARCEICLVLAPTDDNDVRNCARVQFEHGQCVTTRIARRLPLPALPGPVLPGPGEPPVPEIPFPPGKGPPDKLGLPEKEKGPPEKEKGPAAGEAKLELKMTGPKQQFVNLPARYRITVSNPGTAPATNVQVANPVPAGATLVKASAGSRLHAGQVAWNLGTLPPGGSRTVEILLKAKAAGEVCNRATALADGGLKAQAEVCTDFKGVSALTLELVDTKDPLPVKDETSYRITITNQGTAPVTNLRLTALVPPQLRLLETQGPTGPPPKDKLPGATAEGQSLPFAPLKELPPGATATYEVRVQALVAGDIRFRVELIADGFEEGGPVREEESTRVFDPEAK